MTHHVRAGHDTRLGSAAAHVHRGERKVVLTKVGGELGPAEAVGGVDVHLGKHLLECLRAAQRDARRRVGQWQLEQVRYLPVVKSEGVCYAVQVKI